MFKITILAFLVLLTLGGCTKNNNVSLDHGGTGLPSNVKVFCYKDLEFLLYENLINRAGGVTATGFMCDSKTATR